MLLFLLKKKDVIIFMPWALHSSGKDDLQNYNMQKKKKKSYFFRKKKMIRGSNNRKIFQTHHTRTIGEE